MPRCSLPSAGDSLNPKQSHFLNDGACIRCHCHLCCKLLWVTRRLLSISVWRSLNTKQDHKLRTPTQLSFFFPFYLFIVFRLTKSLSLVLYFVHTFPVMSDSTCPKPAFCDMVGLPLWTLCKHFVCQLSERLTKLIASSVMIYFIIPDT